MSLASSPPPPPQDDLDVLERFEDAWRSGTSPRIEGFLPSGAARPRILQELIKLDLEYRWRGGDRQGGGPRLEAYLTRFPELGPAERLPLRLIGEEYWVRQRWGDRPNHAEYTTRFPHHGQALLQALQRLDSQLNVEQSLAAQSGAPVAAPTQPIISVSAFVDVLRGSPLLDRRGQEVLAEAAGRCAD